MRSRSLVASLALSGAVLLAAGCGSESDGSVASGTPSVTASASPSATATSSPTPQASPTATPSPAPSPSVAPELEDGRHFGFIRSIDTSSMTMVFDLAYFLTGDEANQAAAEHGDETPVPNDYFIVNDNPKLRTLGLAPDVEILFIDWSACCEPVPGELEPFARSFTKRSSPYQGGDVPYWLTVEGGTVVAIEQQYLP